VLAYKLSEEREFSGVARAARLDEPVTNRREGVVYSRGEEAIPEPWSVGLGESGFGHLSYFRQHATEVDASVLFVESLEESEGHSLPREIAG